VHAAHVRPETNATPVNMPVVPVRTAKIAITAPSGDPPSPNSSAVFRTKSVFGNPPKPKSQMPSDATTQ